ncbi:hypothetical protein [Trinickia soli]|jgi:hypothetical protein|uniref:Uncharacterized protein n=1 Tax=Trinickia soli TaxID=380675 RepID=A0A2N7VF53_9BURK|nr:hypothetical protein [Trinickia soli]KAA0087916.1 hypothetical protein CIW54_13025 [Paraburkholderia sp. T12-10]PMS15789.1 hypothetical protein C0Z19_27025 [Trinickia soli]CAB3728241.1 hypothetical protein LMG24076_05237 [Trinickia soli]
MHARHSRALQTSLRRLRAGGLASALFMALLGAARADSPPTCRSEVDHIAETLRTQRQPELCPRCADRLVATLESLYRERKLPTSLFLSADAAQWDDPQTRPVMFSGKSRAGIADGDRLAAEIDSGYGPRGVLRLIYTRANEPVALATPDRKTFIPVTYCIASPK